MSMFVNTEKEERLKVVANARWLEVGRGGVPSSRRQDIVHSNEGYPEVDIYINTLFYHLIHHFSGSLTISVNESHQYHFKWPPHSQCLCSKMTTDIR